MQSPVFFQYFQTKLKLNSFQTSAFQGFDHRVGGHLSGHDRDRNARWAEGPLPALQHVLDGCCD